MRNVIFRTVSLFMFLPLVACAVQQRYSNKIYIENICQIPLMVLTENYNNYVYTEHHLSAEVPVGEKNLIGHYTSYDEFVHNLISVDY